MRPAPRLRYAKIIRHTKMVIVEKMLSLSLVTPPRRDAQRWRKTSALSIVAPFIARHGEQPASRLVEGRYTNMAVIVMSHNGVDDVLVRLCTITSYHHCHRPVHRHGDEGLIGCYHHTPRHLPVIVTIITRHGDHYQLLLPNTPKAPSLRRARRKILSANVNVDVGRITSYREQPLNTLIMLTRHTAGYAARR